MPAACLALVIVALSFISRPAAAQIPLPPPANRSVHDLAGVLSGDAARTMEAMHRELFQKTGVAIVVLTVPALAREPIADFGQRVAEAWGVGRATGEDRGVVVVLAIEEQDITIRTGYGVEGFLPDGRVGAILDGAVPAFAQGDFSAGLLTVSGALVDASGVECGVTIEGIARVPRPAPDRSGRVLRWIECGVVCGPSGSRSV